MTIALINSNLNPSLSQINDLILQLNAIFATVSVAGDEAVSGNLAVTGTTLMTGNATASGTLAVTGVATLNGGIVGGATANIAINTNKLTVAASTGNTLIAGTLAVTGAQTLTGVTTANGGVVATGLRVDAATTLTAVGTDRATSLALTASVNNITTAASGTGVTLPACAAGKIVVVNNLGANAIKVYGAGSDTVDGAAAATGVTLTNAKRALFVGVSTAAYISIMGVAAA